MDPRAFIFDAYGTLFDIHSVVLRAGAHFPHALSILWRQKQLEYTWLRSLMDRHADFWEITEAALRSAAGQLQIELNDTQVDTLMQAYLFPDTFPDVKPALERLQGTRLAILSNGTPEMLQSAVRRNNLESYFEEIISVERVRIYKPSRRVYALGPESLNLPVDEILFVSSNSWDVAGAKAFGYRVAWCNRSGAQMEKLGFAPDRTVSSLDELASSK